MQITRKVWELGEDDVFVKPMGVLATNHSKIRKLSVLVESVKF